MEVVYSTAGGDVSLRRATLEHVSHVWRTGPLVSVVQTRASYNGMRVFRELALCMAPEGSPRAYTCAELCEALAPAISLRATGIVRHVLQLVAEPRDFHSAADEMCAQRIVLMADRGGFALPPALLALLRRTIMGASYPTRQLMWRVATHPADPGFPAHALSIPTLVALRVRELFPALQAAACARIQRAWRRTQRP